jgi:hypothetical protein
MTVYIITGPTHCGKSTYIQEKKSPNDKIIDLIDSQDGHTSISELMRAQYDFLWKVEMAMYDRREDEDIWIEGCWSNPYRVGQIVNTIFSAAKGEDIDIKVIYILRTNEWYYKNLDVFEASYAAAQLDNYELYKDSNVNAVYKILNNNEDLIKIK